jgi:uracil-DNA glycosylase
VALGATAARALIGRTVIISKVRGEILSAEEGRVMVTMHPSALLRIESEDERAEAYTRFVEDLRVCARAMRAAS